MPLYRRDRIVGLLRNKKNEAIASAHENHLIYAQTDSGLLKSIHGHFPIFKDFEECIQPRNF